MSDEIKLTQMIEFRGGPLDGEERVFPLLLAPPPRYRYGDHVYLLATHFSSSGGGFLTSCRPCYTLRVDETP